MQRDVLTTDIETRPNIPLLVDYFNLDPTDKTDKQIFDEACEIQRERRGNDFMPVQFHIITAASFIYYNPTERSTELVSLHEGIEGTDEKSITEVFFSMIDKLTPTLVTWNGGNFDGLVFQMSAARHKIRSPKWFNGLGKWEKYRSRYHDMHVDLADEVGNYTGNRVGLDIWCKMIGLPGKIGVGGENVFEEYLEGNHIGNSQYCDIDTVNTHLAYLNWEHIHGREITDIFTSVFDRLNILRESHPLMKEYLEKLENSHWMEHYAKS